MILKVDRPVSRAKVVNQQGLSSDINLFPFLCDIAKPHQKSSIGSLTNMMSSEIGMTVKSTAFAQIGALVVGRKS